MRAWYSEDRARRLSQARQQRQRQIQLPEEVTSSSDSSSDADTQAEADRLREKQLVLVIKADVQVGGHTVQPQYASQQPCRREMDKT